MDAERWTTLEDLFAEAVGLAPAERERFLADACGEDGELMGELRSLLTASEQAGDFVGDLSQRLGIRPLGGEPAPSLEGRRIGAYRLGGLLGRGGMGAVYAAERVDGEFEQHVALKLLPMGLRGRTARDRFYAERQILARLEHPAIARLLDGGVAEDGTPWFALERVSGLPVDTYCASHELGVEACLDLFLSVCDGVQYAHKNLVVHRDLKPANILVSDDGEVKLLDFGIAKVLAEDSPADALTRLGRRPMTPAYATPEQIRGEPITTASDVYSLGVLLFELLTGSHPHGQLGGLSTREIERIVLEEEVALPSSRVTTERRRRRLKGDLDTIVLAAMHREPDHRYPSAGQLAEDVRRHLSGLPVTAHSDTLRYRASRFVQRHRVGVAATAVVTLLTVATAGVSLQFAITSQAQARVIAQERDKAERVTDFLVGLFESADPRQASGEDVTAVELLADGAARIETELLDQPEVRAEMLTVMGRVYHSLGLFDQAGPLLEEGVTLRRATLGDDHLDVAESLRSLSLYHLEAGRVDQAEAPARQAVEIARAQLPEHDPVLADNLAVLASVVQGQGDFVEAEALHRSVLESRRRQFPNSDDKQVGVAANQLALLLMDTGDYDEAEALQREALAIDRQVLGADHVDVAYDLNNLAWLVIYVRGDMEEGQALQEEVVRIFEGVFPADHPNVATVHANLAGVMRENGDVHGARDYYARALDSRRRVLGNEHGSTALAMGNLAWVLDDLGDHEAADALFRESLDMLRDVHGPDHHQVARGMHNLGSHLILVGEEEEAERLLRGALEMRVDLLGDDHMDVAMSRQALAESLMAQGRLDEAERLSLEALDGFHEAFGEEHTSVAWSLGELGRIAHERGDPPTADTLWTQALDVQRAVVPGGTLQTAEILVGLGRTEAALGRAEDCRAHVRQALDLMEQVMADEDGRVSVAKRTLAACDSD